MSTRWITGLIPHAANAVGGLSVHADAVRAQRFGDWLEEGRPARGAVAAAAGGEADRLGAVEQGTAGVTGLGTDIGLDEAVDDLAVAVVDGGVEGLDGAAVNAGGGAAAFDGLADVGVGGGGDVLAGAVVEVDGAGMG